MTLRLNLMRWLLTLVGVQMLCGVVWVLGPLLPPLDPWPARAAVIMLLVLVWATANLALDLGASRQDAALTRGVVGAAADEATAVGQRLAAAVAAMRKAKGRRFRLYDQPWYAIIGPPGAGKTTALLNAGLHFPQAEQAGALSGVGGTRLLDWWFTSDAVLIDTAGRYTTQDSSAEVDRAGWEAFLDLLRRARPKQPLNGVIVAISLSDVASDPAASAMHARAIRARIDELEARLGLRIPVYAMFTKADLLAGFAEYFDDLDKAGREQIWGATFPLNVAPDVAAALRPLAERIDLRLPARLDAEPNIERRALVAGFPAQLASILVPVQAFVAAAFGPSAAGRAPMLRGLYLTSGTQEGTPIDRLVGALSRSFGLEQRAGKRAAPGAGRSYFLSALLRDVVFREAPLVTHKPGAARRRMVLRATGFAACALVAIAAAAAVILEGGAHQGAISRAEAAIQRQQSLAATLPLDPVADADVASLVPWLDAAAPPTTPPPADRLGFAQDDKLAAAARAQYRHALEFALLPRLVWRAETRMRGLTTQPEPLYQATRVYLMLGGIGPVDAPVIQDWFQTDWASAYPGEQNDGLRARLGVHLAALLAEPLPEIPLDGPLVASARAVISRVPLAARAWSRLKPLAAMKELPAWKPAESLGPAGVRIFLRLSGRGLEEGIPPLYTIEGARDAVLPALPRAAADAAAEGWVMGIKAAPDEARRTLEADILAIYAAEYQAAWDAMLLDLDPAPLRSLTQAAQDLFIIASPRSPMRALLASAAQQLAPGAATKNAALGAIDTRFAPLRGLFGTGGAAPIDLVLRPLGDLQQQLAKQAASTTRAATPNAGEDPAAALRAEAIRQPQPLARWLVSLATAGASLRDGGPRGAMMSAWNATGGAAALCPRVIANNYPFVPAATSDAAIDDFTRLFAPGGALDAFFNTQLKPFVDMTAKPWKLQQVDNVSAPLTAGDLAQFQRAAAIRDLFFPAGSTQPLVRFDVTPGPLDAAATGAVLDLGGAPINAARDAAARPVALTWPARPRLTAARVVVNGPQPLTVETQGAWATFRLIAAGKPTLAGDRTQITFAGNDRSARFELRANPNPFTATVLSEFRCPAIQ